MNETNPKDLIGVNKPRLYLVPPASIIYQALAMQDGAKKYGPYNWREKKVVASIYIDAVQRHLLAWLDGEENAQDSGYPHLAHALACIGIIVDALETGNLVDDRPKPGAAAKVLERWTKESVPAQPATKSPETWSPCSCGSAAHGRPWEFTTIGEMIMRVTS